MTLVPLVLPTSPATVYDRRLQQALAPWARGVRSALDTLESEVMGQSLAVRYDQDAEPPTVAYLGHAQPGTAESAATWRIQRLTFGGDGDVAIAWADGNAQFDNVWMARAALSYS